MNDLASIKAIHAAHVYAPAVEKLNSWYAERQQHAHRIYTALCEACHRAGGGGLAIGVHGREATVAIQWPGKSAQLRLLHARAGEIVGYQRAEDESDRPEPGIVPPPDAVEAYELALNVVPELRAAIDSLVLDTGWHLLLCFDGKRAHFALNDRASLDGALQVATYRPHRGGQWPEEPADMVELPHWLAAKVARGAR